MSLIPPSLEPDDLDEDAPAIELDLTTADHAASAPMVAEGPAKTPLLGFPVRPSDARPAANDPGETLSLHMPSAGLTDAEAAELRRLLLDPQRKGSLFVKPVVESSDAAQIQTPVLSVGPTLEHRDPAAPLIVRLGPQSESETIAFVPGHAPESPSRRRTAALFFSAVAATVIGVATVSQIASGDSSDPDQEPTAEPSTTVAPTTEAPALASTTAAPTTTASTAAPTTVPTTATPETEAPLTEAPTTVAPAPAPAGPTTQRPVATAAPRPTTQRPVATTARPVATTQPATAEEPSPDPTTAETTPVAPTSAAPETAVTIPDVSFAPATVAEAPAPSTEAPAADPAPAAPEPDVPADSGSQVVEEAPAEPNS